MSRTYRNITGSGYFRRPKTHAYKRKLLASEKEIREELGVNYLAGNFANINNIVTSWDDKPISARSEFLSLDSKLEKVYKEKITGWFGSEWDNPNHTVEFDIRKNMFWAYRKIKCLNYNNVNYVPFVVTVCNKQYPVKIRIDKWYV